MSLKSWLNTIKLHLKSEFCSEKQAGFIGLDLESIDGKPTLFVLYEQAIVQNVCIQFRDLSFS